MYPAGQSVQVEDPELDEYVPTGQFWHAAIEFYPVNGLKVLFQFFFSLKLNIML